MTDQTPPRTLTRRQLYDLVWSTPMQRLARSFGMSDVWLAKLCRQARVPTPRPGYWAKKRAGKRVQKLGLPKSVDENEVVELATRIPRPAVPEVQGPPLPPPHIDPDVAKALEAIQRVLPIEVPTELRARPHPLVALTKRALVRASKRGSLDEFGHLAGRDHPRPLNVAVGPTTLDRALRIMDTLLRVLAMLGFKTEADEHDRRAGARTVVLGEVYRMRLREKIRQRAFDPKVDGSSRFFEPKIVREPNGILELEIRGDGFNHPLASWRDGTRKTLEQQIGKVLTGVVRRVQTAREARQREEEAARRRLEAKRKRWQEEEARRIEQRRVDELVSLATSWERASQLRRFVGACREMAPADDGTREWLAWAEAVAERLDPLAEGLDALAQDDAALKPSSRRDSGNCWQ